MELFAKAAGLSEVAPSIAGQPQSEAVYAGKTVTYIETQRRPQLPALKDLAADIAAGRVETLVILGGNPAYDAPADLEFSAAIKKVPTTIHLGVERNDTERHVIIGMAA